MLGNVAEPLRRALLSETDQIFTFEENGASETFHLAKSHFVLDAEPHTLISVRHMTREISRQEITVLKKTLRIIGHELANSMAPASSLLRSVRTMLERPDRKPDVTSKIEIALRTVEERLHHLQGFLSGLADLGQLPKPKKREVAWQSFLDGLRTLWSDVAISAPLAEPGWFDPAQIQQVIINLVKNAHEAGGPRDGVAVEVETAVEGGVGLTLCREIVDAHDGQLRIGRREGSGMMISFWLPSRTPEATISRARLTLTGAR